LFLTNGLASQHKKYIHFKSINMLVQSLLGEFLHEAENTRKLLNAIPDSALDWKPSEKTGRPHNWPPTLPKPTIGLKAPSSRM